MVVVTETKIQYEVKIINPSGKGGEEIKQFEAPQFSSIDQLEEALREQCSDFISSQLCIQFGYIVPGHGRKGKQLSLTEVQDLSQMYEKYKKRKQVVLWLKNVSKKRSKSPPEGGPPSKQSRSRYDGHLKKMNEVEEIVEKLSGKHDSFTPEQLRAWAHMIHLKKHTSYDIPPNKPFFRNKRGTGDSSVCAHSPGKRINMRSQCIDQLDKWHALMEKGAISSKEYEELQKTILNDIKKF